MSSLYDDNDEVVSNGSDFQSEDKWHWFLLVTDLATTNIIFQMINKSSNGPFQVIFFDFLGFCMVSRLVRWWCSGAPCMGIVFWDCVIKSGHGDCVARTGGSRLSKCLRTCTESKCLFYLSRRVDVASKLWCINISDLRMQPCAVTQLLLIPFLTGLLSVVDVRTNPDPFH